MTFSESVKTCFRKYACFSGKASKSEYWWFQLFTILALMLIGLIMLPIAFASGDDEPLFGLMGIFVVGITCPSLAVSVRRLHDSELSGFHLLWVLPLCRLIPIVGYPILIYLMCRPHFDISDDDENVSDK